MILSLLKKTSAWFWIAVFFLAADFACLAIQAQALQNHPVQITSNPGEDFAPSVSSDGTFMVYVSDTSGNLDLWLKYLGRGVQPPDRRLTFHSTEDKSPVISPDGKQVAFVSHRGDPRGDIYILDLKKPGEPVALVREEGQESDPAWSSDQKYIYYVSRASTASIFKIDISTGEKSQVLEKGGVNLAVSGQYLAFVTGDTQSDLKVLNLKTQALINVSRGPEIDVSPNWSQDGKTLYFARYSDDTNLDGQLGIDDNPNIWKVAFNEGQPGIFRQLTASSSYDFFPQPAPDNTILYTSHRKGGVNIWQLPEAGLIPVEESYEASLKYVNENCSEVSYLCALALSNLIHQFPNESGLASIRYRLAALNRKLKHFDLSKDLFKQVLDIHSYNREASGLSEIEIILLGLEEAGESGSSYLKEQASKSLSKLEAIIKKYSGLDRVEARGFLEKGKLSLISEAPDLALKYSQKVIGEFSGQRDLAAEAAFWQSRIYTLVGNREKLVESYVQVVRDFPDVPKWKQKAIQEILNLHEQQPSLGKKVSQLQALTQTYKDIPQLAAAIQNRIGELYYAAAENLLAKEAYKTTSRNYQEVPAETFKARLVLARIYAEEENFDESLNIYRQISNEPEALEPFLSEAREGQVRKALDKGNWELAVGEIKLALKTFLKIIEFSPSTVEAHRGYLQAAEALKKSDHALKFYQERVKAHPDSSTELYALGLAYTYLDPPALDAAQAEIGKALEQNSQQVYFHQTLGWIYEQKERLQSGFVEKAVHEYQIALALNDENENPRNEADLLLNLGNGHSSLNNPLSANHYYRKREETGLSFLNPEREALYRQRYGEASFKSGDPANAIRQFQKTLKIIEKKNELSRMAELHDRIALAYQDKEDYELAVKHFSLGLELHRQTGNQSSLSRALRNIANNIYSQNSPDSEKMSRALEYYFEAIDKLEKYGVAERKKKSSALIDVNIEVGIGEDVSAAAHGFDKTGEQKLIFHYIGKIYGDFGNYPKAIEYFLKKLVLIPEGLSVEKNIPVLLEKALLLNQLGNYYFQSGNTETSLKYFKDSFKLSGELDNRNGMAVNAANIGRAVLTLSTQNSLASGETGAAIAFLQTAIASNDASSSPESLLILHNYLGILLYVEAMHSDEFTVPKSTEVEQVKSGLGNLRDSIKNINQSIRHFETALELASDANKIYQAPIWQNLVVMRRLGGVDSKMEPWVPPLASRWQFVYLDAMRLADRLPRLLEAEKALTRLPYGAISSDRSTLALIEQLYQEITLRLFEQEKYSEALVFSEKGKKQIINALAPGYQFASEERKEYFSEIKKFAEQLSSEEESLLDEYHEFMELVAEDDPGLVDWVSSNVPSVDLLQSLLGSDEVFLKLQRHGNDILVWKVNKEKVSGSRISGNKELFKLIRRITQNGEEISPDDMKVLAQSFVAPLNDAIEKAQSIVLLPEGRLEFLPWAAFRVKGKTLIENTKLTFVSSSSHFVRSEKLKNLYNSRLLAIEANLPEKTESFFATVSNLKGKDASQKSFLKEWDNFGLVHIESPVRAFRNDPESSFITLNRDFQRISFESLYAHPVESLLMTMTEVEHEFDTRLDLSPTAILLNGLTFKGYPGVLLHSGKPVYQEEFNKIFISSLRKGNPADSLREVQIELAKKFPDSVDWARYRYYGFPGMSGTEKQDFAINNIKSNVKKGVMVSQEGDLPATINYLEKALVLAPFVPMKVDLGENFQEKTVVKALATAAFKLGDYGKSIHYQKKVLPFAEKEEDPEELADAHYFLGLLYSLDEKFPEAVEHLTTALKIFEENEILDRLAQSYSQLGIVEENAAEYDSALKAFGASQRISEEIGEDLNRGREFRRIGKIYSLRLNRFQEAREYFNKAYDLFVDLEQVELQVELLLDLGLVAEKEGNFEKALNYFSQAQVLAEANDFRPGLSKALLYQANSHWFQGDYQQAFRAQRQSLEIAKALDDKLRQAFIYNTLGLIHWTLNDPQRALKNLHLSLNLATEMQSPIDIASAYNNIGLVHRKEKQLEKSIDFFGEALKRDIQLKSKWGQGYTHRNMGMSLMRMEKLDEAAMHFNQAMNFSHEIGDRTNVVKIMLELGHLALERKQWQEAVSLFSEAHELSSTINVKEVSWRALRGQGFALIQLKKNEEAVKVYKQAVKIVDAMRAAIKVEEFQNGFLTDKQDVYKELILLLLNMGKVEDSFQYAERAKSRSFIDLLGNQKISLKNDVSQKLYDILTEQKQTIRKFEEAFAAARSAEKEEAAKELSQQLVEARNRYQNLLIDAKEQSPEISNFITVDAITLNKLYDLLEDDAALVEYLVTQNELIAWVITKGEIHSVRVPVKEQELNSLIADYRDRIQKLAPVEEQSKRLHTLLVDPAEPFIKSKRLLGIVPHGHLHYISFSSLKDGESYLFERHPLFYSPSASVMQYTFKEKAARSGDIKVLALGNPDLGDFNYDLPLAEMEANAIQWDFPKVDILTREKATESWLKKHIGEYQVIHVASHGEFDPINPLFSSLKLTRDKSDDGNFEVNEVFGLDIKADIVTLSACQTGLGDIVGGDELVGLNRAFIYAGTHAILSSLWRVSDISTAVLIKHFYRNFGKEDKAESLRKAQLIVKRLYPHPSYWAGFNLTGDYR